MELQELQRKWLLRAKLKTFIVTQTHFYQLAQAKSFLIHLLQMYLQREAKLLPLNTKLQKKIISWSSPARAKIFLGRAVVPSSAKTCSSQQGLILTGTTSCFLKGLIWTPLPNVLDISKICHVISSLSTCTHVPPLASAGTQELTLSLALLVTQKSPSTSFQVQHLCHIIFSSNII